MLFKTFRLLFRLCFGTRLQGDLSGLYKEKVLIVPKHMFPLSTASCWPFSCLEVRCLRFTVLSASNGPCASPQWSISSRWTRPNR